MHVKDATFQLHLYVLEGLQLVRLGDRPFLDLAAWGLLLLLVLACLSRLYLVHHFLQ